MKLDLFISVSEPFASNKSTIFHELSSRLNFLLKNKEYGEDVKSINGSFIIVLERPGYEEWYKPRKLSYTDQKVSKSKLTGENIEISKQLSFELRLDENSIGIILNSNHLESQKFILQQTINYISEIKRLPVKIRDFDKSLFLKDLKNIQDNLVEVSYNGA